jgi:hypothetical protein
MPRFLLVLLAVIFINAFIICGCERTPKHNIVVASAGGDFTRLSDALKSITDASAINRYTIVVKGTIIEDGNQPEVDGYIDARSHIDVIGQGATIEVWTPEYKGKDYTVQFLDVTDSEWRDLSVLVKELWNQNDFEYSDNGSLTDIGIGCSYPIKIRGQTDKSCRLVNIKTSWDWQAGTKGWNYGGAILDLASPTLIDCEFRGGQWGASTGFIISSIGSPLLMNCRFIGGGGPGIKLGAVNYGIIISNGSATLIGCVAEGGLGSINCHAIYIYSGEPTLVGCVGKPHEFSYVFSYDASNPPVDGKFRPDIGAEYRYLVRDLQLSFPPQSSNWTISVGLSPGGAEIASVAGSSNITNIYDISSIGYVCNAGDYLYITTTNITDKIIVKYTIMPAIGEVGAITAGLYLEKTNAKITGSTFYGTWLWNPPLGISPDACINPGWEITGSSFIQLWKEGITEKAYSVMNWFGPFFEMPAYYCYFNRDFYNVRPADTPLLPKE